MANNCPKCGHGVDTQSSFDCPKCGEQFWNSRKAFNKRPVSKVNSEEHSKSRYFRSENDDREEDDHEEGNDIGHNQHKLPTNFWWRFVVSYSFSEYVGKWLISIFCTALPVTFAVGFVKNELVSNSIFYSMLILYLFYWLSITIGYIYGYYKYKELSKETGIKHYQDGKKGKLGKIYCLKCGKKVDDDSIYCIFCGSEIAYSNHSHHSTK